MYSAEFRLYSLKETEEKTEKTSYIENLVYYEFSDDSGLRESDLVKVELIDQFNEKAIMITLTDAGAKKNYEFTTKYLRKRIALVVDGKIMSAPRIAGASKKSIVITSSCTKDELELIVDSLRKSIVTTSP